MQTRRSAARAKLHAEAKLHDSRVRPHRDGRGETQRQRREEQPPTSLARSSRPGVFRLVPCAINCSRRVKGAARPARLCPCGGGKTGFPFGKIARLLRRVKADFSGPADERAPSIAWTRWAPVLIPLLAIVAYANTWRVPMLLDDAFALINNASIRNLRDLGTVLAPADDLPTAGRPLLNLSFALNYAVGGLAVPGYHAVNLGLHILAGLALFGVVRRALHAGTSATMSTRTADAIAFAIAALWTAHPLQTASVTYISQRAEVLMGMWYFATLYFFARSAVAPREPAWSWLSVGACAAGMLSKEGMVTAPVVVLLYDRTFWSGTVVAALRRRWRYYACLAATWLILAGLMMNSRLEARGVGFAPDLGAGSYLLTQSRVVLAYAARALWPDPLVFDYGPQIMARRLGEVWPYAVAIAAVLAGVAATWRRAPRLSFAGAMYFLALAPTSSLVPILHQPMAENRMYVALAPILAAIVVGAHRWRPGRTAVVVGTWVAALATLTFARNLDYQSDVALWSDTVRKVPRNVRAHTQLAEALRGRGDRAGARRESEIALQLDPANDVAHNNLGLVLTADPRTFLTGVQHLEAAVRARPTYGPVRVNLAVALLRIPERREEAATHLREAIRLSPDYADAHTALGSALILTGRPAEAVTHCVQALRLKPDDPKAHLNLGLALGFAGRADEALKHFRIAVKMDPENPEARLSLANALLRVPGGAAEAIAHYRRALQLRPNYAEAWVNLGLTLKALPNSRNEARDALREALRIQPDLTAAKNALAELDAADAAGPQRIR